MTRRVLLIGATGFFGGRLAQHLAKIDALELVVTSRDPKRAETLAKKLRSVGCSASVAAAGFDRDAPSAAAQLAALTPWLVIDASGPFQAAGYELAHATISFGAHWIDLADARDYLIGFGQALDGAASKTRVAAIAGASSSPAISCAAARALTDGWRRIDTIDIAIYPGGGGAVGLAAINAQLHAAGTDIGVFREGRADATTGWGGVTREAMAGVGRRFLSPVETAEDALMPIRFGVTSRVAFRAGLEVSAEHLGLVALARLRKRGVLRSLTPFGPWLERARRATRLIASDRGGMTVRCTGLDRDGQQSCAAWTLTAERGDGPNVPVLPVVVLVKMLLRDELNPGARTAADELTLDAIEAEMRSLALTTARNITKSDEANLIDGAVGSEDYRMLPPSLRAFHDTDGYPVWRGEADVDNGRGPVSWLLRRIFGFPGTGRNVPVSVTVDRKGGEETWTRNFGGARFRSHLKLDSDGTVAEHFGPFSMRLGVTARGGEIAMPVAGWRFLKLPMPRFLAPISEAREFADADGRFNFDVRISMPVFGLVAHYRGWLKPARDGVAAPKSALAAE